MTVSTITAMSSTFSSFPDDLRDRVINQLDAISHGTRIIQSSLSAALKSRCNGSFLGAYPANVHHRHSIYSVVGVVEDGHLFCLLPDRWGLSNPLRHPSSLTIELIGLSEKLKSKIFELARKAGGPVGSAAVEALVALDALDAPRESKLY